MKNNKGFTMVELLIVLVVALVIGMITYTIIKAATGNGNYCDYYKYSSVSDTPVSCYNYLKGGNDENRNNNR